MSTNRLTTHQFGPGVTADGTRIEQALRELVALYNDVPADLVLRRWSCSPLVWGWSPPTTGTNALPFMGHLNTSGSVLQPPTAAQIHNTQRVKSCRANSSIAGMYTVEVALTPERPIIIGSLSATAEWQTGGPYANNWTWGAAAPAGFAAGDPTSDVTLQACLADAWDLENRKKLRQESLVYRTRSDVFAVQPDEDSLPTDIIFPQRLVGAKPWPFRGFLVEAKHPVLVPAEARVVLQFTVPVYSAANVASWPLVAGQGNVWTFGAQVWEGTR